jgi:hypothetical protein
MKMRAGAGDGQTTCCVENTLKMKDLDWLPFIDAIRTFLRSEPELMFKLPSLD